MTNYQIETDKIINANREAGKTPKLLLHSCCAPCSSYVIEYLSEFFEITVLYHNPNIFPHEEYEKRKKEQLRLISEFNKQGKSIHFIDCDYDHSEFLCIAKGREADKEGGLRCHACYEFRMRRAALEALQHSLDYFATTLTVSPYKNAEYINSIGYSLESELHISYLPSDFKKRNGYKRSIELSKEFDLYRQNYCGCEFSMN